MTDFDAFVKSQIAFHEGMAKKFANVPKRLSKHLETAATFQQLGDHLQSIAAPASHGALGKKPIQLAISFDELEGLPPELMQELSVSDGDRADFTILKIIESLGGVASLDRILVGLYKETGEIMKRAALTSKIYRMSQKGLVFSVPSKKGVYSIQELTEEQAANLF
jgi:hypothetical protein